MSLLGNLFGNPQGNPLETHLANEFAAYKNSINQRIAQEDAALQSLNIKPPRIVSKLDYKTETSKEKSLFVTLISPQFEIPPHRIFVIKDDGLVATLFENLERIDSVYYWWGLANALQLNYGLVWTNRDPFIIYRSLQKHLGGKFDYRKDGDFKSSLECRPVFRDTYSKLFEGIKIVSGNPLHNYYEQAKELPLLKKAEGLSYAQASQLHLRAQIYNYVTDGKLDSLRDPSTFYGLDDYGARFIRDDLLFQYPVPITLLTKEFTCLKIIPKGEIKPARMIEFIQSLHGEIESFISFELLRESETVCFRLRFADKLKDLIVKRLDIYFPDFEWVEDSKYIQPQSYTINWLKKKSLYNSVRGLRDFQIDPYAHFASLFDKLPSKDTLCYQIMFAPLTDEAAGLIDRGLSYSLYDKDKYRNKFLAKLPLWFVSISVSCTNEQASSALIQTVARTYDTPNRNFSSPYSRSIGGKVFPIRLPAFLSMCGTEELAALAHFPISDLPIERLEKVSMKNVQPPEMYTTGDVRLGESRARGQIFPVTIPETVRDRHVYVVGKSGTGKSTLIETIARRDIEAGRGVAVIDPHGDLVQHLLDAMPEHRVADCVLFSPRHFPVSLEILTAENEHEIDLLSDDLITMFRRTSESWGDKMQAILQMSFQTLLRVPGSSFTDITRLLTDESFRRQILSQINHPQLASFWEQRYDVRQAEPILIRMDRLTTSGTLRAVLTQNKNSLNFYDVISESKIFLADLSKGYLGESTSHLLGSIIVSQIQLAAMRQAHLPSEQRIPFSLFVDEVQNFTTSAFSTILSEARKQKLRLTIAHQFVSQLPTDLQKAVFGNVGTLIFFALSPDDLGAARHELGTFEPADVANLPKYHALCRPATAARDTFSFATDPSLPLPAQNFKKAIIEQTRREYAPTVTVSEDPPAESDLPRQNPATEKIVSAQMDFRRPAFAVPLIFATNGEKILHFLRQAEYLSQPQIIALTALQASNASTALKKLVDTGQIKTLDERRPKIYFVGRTCNPTVHNLLVRDLFVKINASNFATRSVKFNDSLTDLKPDLSIEFLTKEENTITPLPAYFELDRGTEGVQELVRKAERYAQLSGSPRVCFVFEREPDMLLARKTIQYPFISYATLDQFTSLEDKAFYAVGGAPANDIQLPFFGS